MIHRQTLESENPGIRLANSTTRCMHGVINNAKCSHSSIFCASKLSDTEPISGDEQLLLQDILVSY
ncbi:hypothetical protein DERF_006245 [Dermatophagoides farinae]|uniref:Uncharacterized protein n=1 Tax=Dermatophagoides farinae TaxID=6954 RepID=A0A922I5S3_DERFA|nr:hypothetical protein DERF_006245 [Dermatophagoides farinae]